MIEDWDAAYANAAHIPGGDRFPALWAERARAFRALIRPEVIPYGPHERERIDLFRPEGAPAGLVVFVHGGYWRAFDRGDWSHLAAGPLARGWAAALVGYVLAPEARLGAIRAAVGGAIAAAAKTVSGPLRLVGHSAGGHLVVRQVCDDAKTAAPVLERIDRVVSISGLHDLRPLLRTGINEVLQLDAGEARQESPALLEPVAGTRLHAWVGAEERPEFVRQSQLIANVWTGLGANTTLTVEPGRHHFDVIEGLEAAGHPLTRAVCGD